MQTPAFWLAVGKIIWINVLLSGDNALVIAMAEAFARFGQEQWANPLAVVDTLGSHLPLFVAQHQGYGIERHQAVYVIEGDVHKLLQI